MLPSPSRLRPNDLFLDRDPGRAELRLVPRENRVAVLLNAHAKRVTPKVRAALAEVVPAQDLYFSESLDMGRAQARAIIEQRYSTVMVGGGDGTIATAMNLLLEAAETAGRGTARHSLPDIGILKLGTGNGLCSLTGAGKPLDDVKRVLAGERPDARPLRLMQDAKTGWVYPFASIGYDAQVLNDYVEMVSEARTDVGRAIKKSLPGYFIAIGTRTIPTELRQKRAHVRIVGTGRSSMIDPETNEEVPIEVGATLFEGVARSVAMGTAPFYGFGMKVLPHALRRTDRFHVRVSAASISFLLSHLPSLWNGSLQSRDFYDFLVEGVRIESNLPLPLQMAGDARGHTQELEVRLADRSFRLLEGTGSPASL